ncbi:hypothetical protein EV702DRAFT_619530 [Suillus placidus]|uniref:Uncharacterized protein n=1 Tax=Suillus placidus TaxID=48579 RepID=A0A9P6ZN51_9AGAM|nr:hypothetical protein EV702DRAFT_619530 [Suillus placidus]
MVSFKKLFHKSHDDKTLSLKHSKSMTFGLSSQGNTRDPRTDPLKPAYRGKTPLKTSDIVYIEQAPGILDIQRAQWYPDLRDLSPPCDHFDTYADLLDQFPSPPPPPPRPPRSALRTTSLNSKNSRPKLPLQNDTSYQHVAGRQRTIHRSPSVACFSRPTAAAYPSLARKQQREATPDQDAVNVLHITGGQVPVFGSSRPADRVSSAGRSYTPAHVTPAPPVPTTHSPHPPISRSAHNSRTNLRQVPPHLTIPPIAAPDHGQFYWPHNNYLEEQDPNVISTMISRYPVAPCYDPSREQLRPIRFDMEDPSHFRKTLSYFIHMAVAQGRPLDARADGPYHRIIDAGDPTGIVPEIGADWSRQMEYR